MKPILYAPGEVSFTNNGLGRLNDIVSCEVIEELNTGVYECNFTYPVTGELYGQIQLGCIVAVTHDDTGDIQPFDIVGYTRPISGIVSYHAVHISYRLSHYIAVPGLEIVDRLSRVSTLFDNAFPHDVAGRFSYCWPGLDDKRQFMTATADGLPRSVRQYIGMEGGVLDTFTCEVNWNRFIVEFLERRGQYRNFSIRYGVNLADYNEEANGEETYMAAVAYWHKENVVVYEEVYSGLPYYDHVGAVAMDLTSRFDSEPTEAELAAAATELMVNGRVNLPSRSIEVDFVHLKDLEEYQDYAALLTVELGDSISVIFPAYNIASTYRVVRTSWNPLTGKFNRLTLGSLKTTLAEALGTGRGSSSYSGSSGGSVVVVTPVLSTGTKVADITVDGVESSIYAPTPTAISVSRTLKSGEKISTITVNGTATDIWGRAPSNDAPQMDGTTAAGSSNAFARADHVHPTDTSRQAALVSGTNIKTVNGNSLLGPGDLTISGGNGNGVFYGTCVTAANTADKVVVCPEFTASDLVAGAVVYVDFTAANTIANPTLNVNGTGDIAIRRYGTTAPSTSAASSWNAGSIVCMIYDGTYWNIEGWLNTTYSAISQANIESLTATSAGLITGARLTQGVAKRVNVSQTLTSGTEIGAVTVNGAETKLFAPSGAGITGGATVISNFTATGHTFTAQSNGVVTFCWRASAAASYLGIQDTTLSRYVAQMTITTNQHYGCVCFPVVAGRTYKIISLTNATSQVATVVYFT